MVESTPTAFCPECHADIPLPDSPEMYMRFSCPDCGTALEIVNDSPWEVDYDSNVEMDTDEEMFFDDYASEELEDEDFPEDEEPL